MERLLLALDDEEDEDEDGLDCYIMPLGEEAKDLAMQIIAMLEQMALHVKWIMYLVA